MDKIKPKIIRSFVADDKTYHIVEPNLNIVRESKYRFSKKFTDSIKEGFYTKKKLESVLKEGHADLIDSHIEKRSKLLTDMAETQKQISESQDPIKLRFLAELMRIYREAIFQEDLSMKSLFDSTADVMADEERINYLTFSLTRDDELNPLWDSYEDYLSDNNYPFVEACRYELMCWEYKIDPNWQETLPETAAMHKAQSIIEDLQAEEDAKDVTEKIKELKKHNKVNQKKAKAETIVQENSGTKLDSEDNKITKPKVKPTKKNKKK